MRGQCLHPHRNAQHYERHVRSARPLRGPHVEVLQAHHHRGHQVDVAEGQRGCPDPELLGTRKGFAGAALSLHADKLLTTCVLEAVTLLLVTAVALAYAISLSGTPIACLWSELIVL